MAIYINIWYTDSAEISLTKEGGTIGVQNELRYKQLLGVKKNVAKDNFTLLEYRLMNKEFIEEHGLAISDVKDAILALSLKECVKGPEPDRDTQYPGSVCVYKTEFVTGIITYIKIRYNPPDEVVCISFHEDI